MSISPSTSDFDSYSNHGFYYTYKRNIICMSKSQEPVTLSNESTADDLEYDVEYVAEVNNCEEYGVFVNVTPHGGTDVSGLVHISRLPLGREPQDYQQGDQIIVKLHEIRDEGDIGFDAVYDEGHISQNGDSTFIQSPLKDAIETMYSLDKISGYDVIGYKRDMDEDKVSISVTFEKEN